MEHSSYSPDLAPSDFHLFELLKKHLGRRWFINEKIRDKNDIPIQPRDQSNDYAFWLIWFVYLYLLQKIYFRKSKGGFFRRKYQCEPLSLSMQL